MDVRDAVQSAKQHLLELFSNEPINFVGLEEVDFNDESQEWIITVSFTRFWESSPVPAALGGKPPKDRHYKVFRIDDADGRVKSIKDRVFATAK